MKALGQHLLVELYGCESRLLDQLDVVRAALLETADLVSATVLGITEHRFEPQGVSVVVVIAESHVSIHTWPEHGYAAADVFTCSGKLDGERVVDLLRDRLQARQASALEVKRGILAGTLADAPASRDRLTVPA